MKKAPTESFACGRRQNPRGPAIGRTCDLSPINMPRSTPLGRRVTPARSKPGRLAYVGKASRLISWERVGVRLAQVASSENRRKRGKAGRFAYLGRWGQVRYYALRWGGGQGSRDVGRTGNRRTYDLSPTS
jgi:hypothetical protein